MVNEATNSKQEKNGFVRYEAGDFTSVLEERFPGRQREKISARCHEWGDFYAYFNGNIIALRRVVQNVDESYNCFEQAFESNGGLIYPLTAIYFTRTKNADMGEPAYTKLPESLLELHRNIKYEIENNANRVSAATELNSGRLKIF